MKKFLILTLLTLSVIPVFGQFLTPFRTSLFRGAVRNFSKTQDRVYTLGYEFGLRSYVSYSTNWGSSWIGIGNSWSAGSFNASDNLNMISFPVNNIGYVGGESGKLYKTTNNGSSWVSLTDTNRYMGGLNGAWFFSPDTGYICGAYSRNTHLLRTFDGGVSWTAINTGSTNTAYDMYWESKQNGWMTASSSRVLRTTDGGTTWTNVFTTTVVSSLYRIARADVNTFYVCGTGGMIAKSTNGGASFTQLTAPAGTYYALDFTDANNGIVMGSGGGMIKTTDGGVTWTAITTLYSTEVLKACIKVPDGLLIGGYLSTLLKTQAPYTSFSYLGLTSRDIYSVSVDQTNPNKIVAAGDRGDVSFTTNRGLTWTKTVYPGGNLLYDAFINGNQISLCGQAGSYYVSTNLGTTWTERIFPNTSVRNYKLFFINPSTAYMSNNTGAITYTTDAGLNWATRSATGAGIIYDIKMTSASNGWAVGNGERIYRTQDACLTWSHAGMVTPLGQIAAIFMTNDTTGYCGGQTGALFYTNDGFKTVQLLTDTIALNSRVIHDILVVNGTMYAVGTGGLLLVKRQGQPIQQVNATLYGEDLLSISKSSTNEIYVSGADGIVYQLTDNIPVELTSLTSLLSGNVVRITWKTATETNAKDFIVQRKFSGTDWIEIERVQAVGTSSVPSEYLVTDRLSNTGMYEYRLIQNDFDGKTEVFSAGTIEFLPQDFTVSDLFPNPFNPNSSLTVEVGSEQQIRVELFNSTGELMETIFSGKLTAGKHTVMINGTTLNSGAYFIKITSGEKVSIRKALLLK